MNIRDLQYAVSVAELQHFGRAALACHVSQPALSGQIRKLEEQLGVVLFERPSARSRSRRLAKRFWCTRGHCFGRRNSFARLPAPRTDPLSGSLRLGMIPTIGPYLTPVLLRSIARSLPKATLQLSEDLTEALEGALLEGDLDAAVLATPGSGFEAGRDCFVRRTVLGGPAWSAPAGGQ